MSVGQGNSFRTERIAALSSVSRIERGQPSAGSQERPRRQPAAPDDEKDSETDDAPQDVIEWSDALQANAASPAPSAAATPAYPAPSPADSETRHLDLTV